MDFCIRKDISRSFFFLLIVFGLLAYQILKRAPDEITALLGVTCTFLFFLAVLFVIANASYRRVHIDPALKQVSITTRSNLGASKTRIVGIDQLTFVLSYIDYVAGDAARPVNRVELATHSKLSGVALAEYAPRQPDSLLDINAKWQESPQASSLRKELSEALDIEDLGFMGERFILNQL